jgi:hypothetical protein
LSPPIPAFAIANPQIAGQVGIIRLSHPDIVGRVIVQGLGATVFQSQEMFFHGRQTGPQPHPAMITPV